ncbi:uncharacterized protein Z519_01450 [Cladophialophora bantiana CBS 173.52]|uniref:Prion-inhibition and propagation HeLo domain-containing protein n=1 Tax=Cladophialophora bantiana (strain ATCC 10958 / CBS 173.52 / CDC B-1940 / NIH 8579) TaxID=1442370 RepID=A0A0D2F6U9_CLAB1|nr:uncharacterized protein Z519_01450 [Cladophialophora bantiana CBS 173.52]KIW97866.1 hypothetical protein Z519_01450 [Cladophialophora bantiana CBS 173.52]
MNHWTVANFIWMYGTSLYLHHQRLSALAETLPNEFQRVRRRSMYLSLALQNFGEALREIEFKDLEPNHRRNQDVLEMVEKESSALFEVVRGMQELMKIPDSGVWDSIYSWIGFSSPPKEWQMKSDRLLSEIEEIGFALESINHVVTACNARKLSELSDGLEQLKIRQSDTIKRFRLWFQGQRWSRIRSRHVMTADIGKDPKLGFLDDTTAVILVGEIGNVDNILAFFIWYAKDGKKTRFYKEEELIVLEKDRLTLEFRNPKGTYIPQIALLAPVITVVQGHIS